MGEDQTPTNPRNCPSPSTTGDHHLRRLIDEISSLASLSLTIRVFSVKWQLIRNYLHDLNTSLMAAVNSHVNPNNNLPLLDLISSLSITVKETHDLASRCISVSYSGKLLMQSDLDKVIAKLNAAVRSFAGVFNSGAIVSGDLALVVSKPSIGASREDMRFYVRDLLTRLKIGDLVMKRQTLISLNEVLIEDEKYVRVVVDVGDFVILLVNCLDSSDLRVQEEATLAIGVIAGFESYKGALIVSGVIGGLIKVVENGSLRAKEEAIRAVQSLTVNGDNAWGVSAHGGVSVLLNLCSNGEVNPLLIGPSCWVLRNLVCVEEIKRFMIEEGAISTFIKLIKGREEVAQIGSAEFLQSMASGDENVRQLVIKEGGARALVRILDPKSSFSFKLRETAFRAIENLCFCSVEYVNLVISYGFIDHLLFFLRKGDASIQELAFKSASRLCGTSEEARKSMGDAGFMSEFIKFLEAKSYEIREMAAEALSSMVMVPKNRKKFGSDDHNISLILQLLDPKEGNSGNFKVLLSILLSLSSCNHARRKISHSGYVKNIEKLADAGVSDAKRILRKLSTSRFRSMLSGIWHS